MIDKNNPLFLELFPRKPSKGELRKLAIIEHAIKTIGTEGVEMLTFDSIGKALKIRRSHVAYYFKDRRELIEAAIQFSIKTGQMTVIGYLQKAKTASQKLEAYLTGTFEWTEIFPNQIAALILMYYYANFDPQWNEYWVNFKEAGRGRVKEMILTGWKGKISSKELERLSFEAHNVIVINVINTRIMTPGTPSRNIVKSTQSTILQLLGKKFATK